jgi:DNA-binding NarL/FixJ family response regulator
MSAPNKTRIVVIDASPVVRQGIKTLLEEASAFVVTGLYPDLPSFQNRREWDAAFDVLLINPTVVHPYKPFSARKLFPDAPDALLIAIYGGYTDQETLSGFDGILSLYHDGPTLRKNLERMLKTMPNRGENHAANVDLSEREKEILISIANGLTNKEIADKHFISIHTVVSHRKNITRKIGIKTVSGLTIYAVLNNLIT